MESSWITVAPPSLFDLGGFVVAVPMAVAFYAVYWKLGRRRVDLILANLLFFLAALAFCNFMQNNAETGWQTLRWARLAWGVGGFACASAVHFGIEYSGKLTRFTRGLVPFTYAVGVLHAAATLCPHFLQMRTQPLGPRSWLNVAPWAPEGGSLLLAFTVYNLGVWIVLLWIYWSAIRSPGISPKLARQTRTLLVSCIVGLPCGIISSALYVFGINTVDLSLIGLFTICLPAAVMLGKHAFQQERLKDALSRYVSPGAADQILSEGLPAEGELYEVTVLVADIRDFTGIAESLSPQATVRLLNRYFETMTQAIFEHGGMFNKTMGDGLLAIFGMSGTDKDHALSAVRAACQMARDAATVKDDAEHVTPLRIGIGLNSGPAVIGNVGSAKHVDYTAIGDVVNVAARVQQYTKVAGHPVLITEATLARVGQHIVSEAVGEAPVRAKTRSVLVFAVTELVARAEPTPEKIPPPIVNSIQVAHA